MPKPRKKLLLPLLVLLAAGAFAAYKFYLLPHQDQDSQEIVLYGNIDIREVNLAFFATGRIEDMRVDEGDRVKAGDLLATLDDSRYRLAVQRLQGEEAAQQELLAKLEAGTRPQEKQEALAAVKAAEAGLRLAELTRKRMKELSRTKFVPQQKLDEAEAAWKRAVAELDAARQRLSLAEEGPRREDIRRARKQLDSIRAALALARRELEDTRLYAPSPGIIQNRILEPGTMAFPSAPVFSLALTEPMWVRAYIPEPHLGRVKKGMRVEVTTDSFKGKKYRGWVGFISPVAEFTPKAVQTTELRTRLVYRARCFVCPSDELRLGMPVTVKVLEDSPLVESATDFCKDGGDNR